MTSLSPYYQPTYEKEPETIELVFTWLRIWEPACQCIYDTEFSHWINRQDIKPYVESFDDMPDDEKENFIYKLKNIKSTASAMS
jgi:hypothetical protein